MAYDTAESRATRSARISPMEIARNALFTAREKLDLLQQLRTEVTAGEELRADFGPDEIDRAIEYVKLDVQRGSGRRSEPMLAGGD